MSFHRITVEETEPDALSMKRWTFWLDCGDLVFDSYSEQVRKSKRHKFIAVKIWQRISHNARGMAFDTILKERPELTEEIKRKAIAEMLANVKFR